MADEMRIKIGIDRTALVRRVVPGKLVYVELRPEETYAMKLDNIVIRKPDGSYDHYRGQPLSTLGLDSGKKVTVWTDNEGEAPRSLVVDEKILAAALLSDPQFPTLPNILSARS